MYDRIDERGRDALREICNVGAGHAATALSQLTGRRIDLEVPLVHLESVQRIPEIVGGAGTVVAGLYFKVLGDARGVILILLPEDSARAVVGMVAGGTVVADMETEMGISAMKEIGNILASAFLSAIGQLTGLSIIPSVPGFSRDMAGSILDLVLIELSRLADVMLVIDTVFLEVGEGMRGHFFFVPDPQTLEKTLAAAETAAGPRGRG